MLSLSEKKSSPKAGMLSRAPESPIIPNILGIIQRRGKMEGTSIESDLMRSLGLAPAPEEVVPEEELELSFLTALELEADFEYSEYSAGF